MYLSSIGPLSWSVARRAAMSISEKALPSWLDIMALPMDAWSFIDPRARRSLVCVFGDLEFRKLLRMLRGVKRDIDLNFRSPWAVVGAFVGAKSPVEGHQILG
ncbi:hypothetical protein F3Y22_tig00111743pilonHSYRG00017 [Hibiscus syriacus]|uniref:Uncharacterized protein n=1 Tax=Hibiscus syriacus TaxID=106335 RepID=A0A6A2XGK0_HIBSY|nr:hypothetical protein F3Y22_tig00111743pilonHSYRG00017 [Hibiscus syriacus]